jgi:serine/threonine protein kinase
MAAALAAAHRAGVVHRDFKSHNVMIVEAKHADEEARVVVTDFGLARRSTRDHASAFSLSMTDVTEISGTPAYMAPEQVAGGPVTPATDVYAFGVVLYELVTGVCPFVADTPMRTANKRLLEPPPSPRVHVPDIDPRWEATILRCLAREPADRFTNIADAAAALDAPAVEPAAARARRWRQWTIAATSIGALAVAAAGYAWYAAERTPGITSIAVLPFELGVLKPQLLCFHGEYLIALTQKFVLRLGDDTHKHPYDQ